MRRKKAGRVVRRWRICAAKPFGLTMWFDPAREVPLLRPLNRSEILDAQEGPAVDDSVQSGYGSNGSVSALNENEQGRQLDMWDVIGDDIPF